jgi:hypothetical protein
MKTSQERFAAILAAEESREERQCEERQCEERQCEERQCEEPSD